MRRGAPPALVARLAATFATSGGDIREVLRSLFTSPEFFDPKYQGKRYKTPLRQLVSAVRAIGAEPRGTAALAGALADLGQPLYEAVGAEGHPVSGAAWMTPDNVVRRVALAGDLAAGRLPGLGAKTPGLSLAALSGTLGAGLTPATRQAADKAGDGLGAAVLLGSPDFHALLTDPGGAAARAPAGGDEVRRREVFASAGLPGPGWIGRARIGAGPWPGADRHPTREQSRG